MYTPSQQKKILPIDPVFSNWVNLKNVPSWIYENLFFVLKNKCFFMFTCFHWLLSIVCWLCLNLFCPIHFSIVFLKFTFLQRKHFVVEGFFEFFSIFRSGVYNTFCQLAYNAFLWYPKCCEATLSLFCKNWFSSDSSVISTVTSTHGTASARVRIRPEPVCFLIEIFSSQKIVWDHFPSVPVCVYSAHFVFICSRVGFGQFKRKVAKLKKKWAKKRIITIDNGNTFGWLRFQFQIVV